MNTQQTNKQTNKQTTILPVQSHTGSITTYILHIYYTIGTPALHYNKQTIGTPALHYLDNYIHSLHLTHRSLITTYILHTFITIGTPALHFLDNYILLTFITLQQTNNWHTGITLPLHITTNTPSYIDTPVLDNYMCIYYQLAHRHYIVIVIVIIVIVTVIIVIVVIIVTIIVIVVIIVIVIVIVIVFLLVRPLSLQLAHRHYISLITTYILQSNDTPVLNNYIYTTYIHYITTNKQTIGTPALHYHYI